VDNLPKVKADDLVSSRLKLPIKNLAEVIAENEIYRTEDKAKQPKLAKTEDALSGPVAVAVHCRSGLHAR